MARAYKVLTTVLPGHRIEVTAPEVDVGRQVEVIVLDDAGTTPRVSVLEFLAGLPPRGYTPEHWREIERQLQEERDAWER